MLRTVLLMAIGGVATSKLEAFDFFANPASTNHWSL
jgi:hypothetical protein